MPYITISQAAEATGKSEKTIRRLINKEESKPYITRDGNGPNAPVQIDSSYLASVYPMSIHNKPLDTLDKQPRQPLDTHRDNVQVAQQSDIEHDYITFLKEELKKRDEQLVMKDRRIEDLTDKLTSIKLLTEGPPTEDSKKRRWWPW